MEIKIPEADLAVMHGIEDMILSSMKLGFDLSELDILDDVNASKTKIQELGEKIAVNNPELAATILHIAHSNYFDHSAQGDVPSFFDAVLRLGADRVKVLIISLSLFVLGKGPDVRRRAAKSASIGILARTIAEQMNLKDECIRQVEIGGLLAQLGMNVLIKARNRGAELSDEFIEKYNVHMATSLVDRLNMDPFIRKAVDMSVLEFDEDSLALVGIIKLAEALTEDSFKKHGKLVLRSPLPDKKEILVRTVGDDVRKFFSILGLEEFIEIREVPTKRQKEAVAGKVAS
jgi:hypothetical protein